MKLLLSIINYFILYYYTQNKDRKLCLNVLIFTLCIDLLRLVLLSTRTNKIYNSTRRYPDNFPSRKIAPQLGLGFGSRLGLVLELGVNQTIALKENSPTVGVSVRVSFGVRGQFFSGPIVLEPYQTHLDIMRVKLSGAV